MKKTGRAKTAATPSNQLTKLSPSKARIKELEDHVDYLKGLLDKSGDRNNQLLAEAKARDAKIESQRETIENLKERLLASVTRAANLTGQLQRVNVEDVLNSPVVEQALTRREGEVSQQRFISKLDLVAPQMVAVDFEAGPIYDPSSYGTTRRVKKSWVND